MKKTFLVLLIFSALVLAACSNAGSTTTNSDGQSTNSAERTVSKVTKNLNPCELMTAAEAQEVIGSASKLSPTPQTQGNIALAGQKICYYEGATAEDSAFAQIALIDPAEFTAMSVKELFIQTKAMLQESEGFQEVSNVGTMAYRLGGLAGGLEVYDEKSNASFKITFSHGANEATADQEARQEALARRIVEKLNR